MIHSLAQLSRSKNSLKRKNIKKIICGKLIYDLVNSRVLFVCIVDIQGSKLSSSTIQLPVSSLHSTWKHIGHLQTAGINSVYVQSFQLPQNSVFLKGVADPGIQLYFHRLMNLFHLYKFCPPPKLFSLGNNYKSENIPNKKFY